MRRVAALLGGLAALLVVAGPAQAATPPTLPDPAWKSVSKEVLIPVDDGVKIAATIA